jgi:hypothetical protein
VASAGLFGNGVWARSRKTPPAESKPEAKTVSFTASNGKPLNGKMSHPYGGMRLAAQVSWSFATAFGYLKANRRPVVAKLHRLKTVSVTVTVPEYPG